MPAAALQGLADLRCPWGEWTDPCGAPAQHDQHMVRPLSTLGTHGRLRPPASVCDTTSSWLPGVPVQCPQHPSLTPPLREHPAPVSDTQRGPHVPAPAQPSVETQTTVPPDAPVPEGPGPPLSCPLGVRGHSCCPASSPVSARRTRMTSRRASPLAVSRLSRVGVSVYADCGKVALVCLSLGTLLVPLSLSLRDHPARQLRTQARDWSSSCPATPWLCGPRQMASPLWASLASSVMTG